MSLGIADVRPRRKTHPALVPGTGRLYGRTFPTRISFHCSPWAVSKRKHYPRSLREFQAWFPTDADCLDYLDWLRWPEEFLYPECAQRRAWKLGDGRYECSECHERVVAFHHDRHAAVCQQRGPCGLPGVVAGERDRGQAARSGADHVRRPLDQHHRRRQLGGGVGDERESRPGDGEHLRRAVVARRVAQHPEQLSFADSGQNASKLLSGVHKVSSLAKRWLLGTHQRSVDVAHLADYLNESRLPLQPPSRSRGLVFFRVLELAVALDPVRYRELIDTPEPGKRRPKASHRDPRPSAEPGAAPARRPWRRHATSIRTVTLRATPCQLEGSAAAEIH